jgi:alkylation response protein AidB-like acyl-CoA dehydrogenase
MDFTFSADQRELYNALCRFFMTEATPELTRELWDSKTGRSPATWRAMAEHGLTGLSVPEELGGMGLGDLEWGLLAHSIGYYGVADPITDTAFIAVALLDALGPDSEVRSTWLPRVAAGEARVAIGHPQNPLVADAHVAALLLICTGDEVHAVDPAAVSLAPHASLDPSRRLFEVKWTPTPRTLIASGKLAQSMCADVLNRGALAGAGQLLGVTARMLDLAVDYAAERKQFGKPIGSFQAVKHLVANVSVKYKFARPVLFRAAYAMAQRDPRRSVYVSHAKLAAGEAARLAARNCIQVHGAMGYTWDVDLQIFAKRGWAIESVWGDVAFHKMRIAEFVLREDAPLGPGHTFTTTL